MVLKDMAYYLKKWMTIQPLNKTMKVNTAVG